MTDSIDKRVALAELERYRNVLERMESRQDRATWGQAEYDCCAHARARISEETTALLTIAEHNGETFVSLPAWQGSRECYTFDDGRWEGFAIDANPADPIAIAAQIAEYNDGTICGEDGRRKAAESWLRAQGFEPVPLDAPSWGIRKDGQHIVSGPAAVVVSDGLHHECYPGERTEDAIAHFACLIAGVQ